MFTYPVFEVEIERNVTAGQFSWPEPHWAKTDSELGGNRCYIDLRRLPWAEAKRVYAYEDELIARIEAAHDPGEAYEIIEEEFCEDGYGLDLGVASTVVALSAARCVPFTSCNAGAFGGSHCEVYPVVAFYGRAEMAELLLECAESVGVGLNDKKAPLVVYATDIRHMRAFAHALIERRSAFRALRFARRKDSKQDDPDAAKQLKLPF